MTTPILGITEVAAAQVNQYAVVNAAIRALEAAGNDSLAVSLASGNATLSTAQFTGYVVFVASGNTVARSITIPQSKRVFFVQNDGLFPLTVVRGSTSLVVPDSLGRWFVSDATTNGLVALTQTNRAPLTIVTESSTTRTLGLADAGKYIRCTNGSPTAVTVPPNSSAAFVIGDQIHLRQAGAGAVTVTQGAGVTVNVPAGGTLVLSGAGAAATLVKVGTDAWDLMGQVVPA